MNASRYFSHFLPTPFRHKHAASVVDFASFLANICVVNSQILSLFTTIKFSLNKVTNRFFKAKSAWSAAPFCMSGILSLFKLLLLGFQGSVNAFLLFFTHFPSFSLLLFSLPCNNSSKFSSLLAVCSL